MSRERSKPSRLHDRRPPDYPDPTPLLLASGISEPEAEGMLRAFGLKDWKQADRNLQEMAGDPQSRKALSVILPHLLAGAAGSADPDQALNEWERFSSSGIQRLQLYQYLSGLPHVAKALSTVFGNSPAMAQTLHRDPLLVYWIEDDRVLMRRQTRDSLRRQCATALNSVRSLEAKYEVLRRFKRREMLRIGIRDLLGEASVEETYRGLSELAALVIQFAYELVHQDLTRQQGEPASSSKKEAAQTGMCVLGMGKLGGWELNYSSDIDLVYVYHAPSGTTKANAGQSPVSNEQYFDRFGQTLTRVLSESTAEGALFRVDLRLRPEGSVGSLTCSVEDALHYYHTRGRTWERLAFLKAKPLAGNLRVGHNFLRHLRPFVLGTPETAADIIPSIQTLRAQILTKIGRRGEMERHIKLGTGGIREVEFIVQGLQLRWGHAHPRIMNRQTLKGLDLLMRDGLLDHHDGAALKDSYRFLRDLEHKIQMVHELQTHLLPAQKEEIAKCAIRMGWTTGPTPAKIAESFLAEYRRHSSRVHTLYERIIG